MRSIQSFKAWKKENYKFKKCFAFDCKKQTLGLFCLDCLEERNKEYNARKKDKNVN